MRKTALNMGKARGKAEPIDWTHHEGKTFIVKLAVIRKGNVPGSGVSF